MTRAFCPGHITCFFYPVRTENRMTTGSRGVGIKLSLGATVDVKERHETGIDVVMDGKDQDCRVTRAVLKAIAPNRNFDVTVENSLPVGQGFGMSAAGAIAAGLCACEIVGKDHDEAFRAAHVAEIENGGGLGDVSALTCIGHLPIRIRAGLPPYGLVRDGGFALPDLSVAVLGVPMNTGRTLSDPSVSEKISMMGPKCVDAFIANSSRESLFALSRLFSDGADLEIPAVKAVLDNLSASGGQAGMCMLGHSVFTALPAKDAERLTGAKFVKCPSTATTASIIHRA
jgi:pantoate kinase